jgi:hypothetical protein
VDLGNRSFATVPEDVQDRELEVGEIDESLHGRSR